MEETPIKKYFNEKINAISEKHKDKILEIKGILNKTFGEDNNQLVKLNEEDDIALKHYMFSNSRSVVDSFIADKAFSVIIRFPKITIKNAKGNSTTIEDLFVKFYIKSDFKINSPMYGMRTTYTALQYKSDYSHSHLPGLSTSWQAFCLGIGPIIKVFGELNKGYNKNVFQALCYHIKAYVVYESVEGTPYKHLERIAGSSEPIDLSRLIDLNESIYKLVLANYSVDLLISMLNLRISETSLLCDISDEFLKKFMELLDSVDSNLTASEKYCLRRLDGTYTKMEAADLPKPSNKVLLKFKNNEYKLVIREENSELENRVTWPNPTLVETFIRKFTREVFSTATDIKETTTA